VEGAHVWAAVVPERTAIGYFGEREYLLDAPVAVRGNDEHTAGQRVCGRLG